MLVCTNLINTIHNLVRINNSTLTQTMQGQLGGLYPTQTLSRALVDEVMDATEDVAGLMIKVLYGSKDEEEKKEGMAKLVDEKGYNIPYWMDKFEAVLKENEGKGNKNGYIVGDTLTIADVRVYAVFIYISIIILHPISFI